MEEGLPFYERMIQQMVHRSIRHDWYVAFISLVLMICTFFWFSPSHGEKISYIYLWPAAIASAVLLLAHNPGLRRLCFLLPPCMALWLWVGCVVNGDAYLTYNRGFILGVFLSFVCLFWLIPSLSSERRERGLQWITLLYCALMLILASFGLYAALTGNAFRTPLSDESIHLVGSRLFFFRYHPNEAGSAFVVALYLLLYLFASYKKRLLRIVFVLTGAAFLWVIGFTGSRTAIFLAAAGVTVLVFMAIEHFLFPNRVWLRWMVGLFVGAVVMVALYFGICLSTTLVAKATPQATENASQQNVATIMGEVKITQATVVRDEHALQTEDARALQFQDISTFNSRAEIWRSGLDYLKKHPLAYLFGVPDNIVARIPQQVGRAEMHMHNAYLEMLLLGGIPGLVMYLFFLAGLAYSGIRLVIHRELNWGLRYLGFVPFLIAANGVTEIYPLFSGNVMDMMYFVIAGAVITFAMDLLPARQRLLQKV